MGAGGKTAAIGRLLRERPDALATTTTHLGRGGFGHGLLAVAPDVARLERMQAQLEAAQPLTLALDGGPGRLQSPPLAWHLQLAARAARRLLLVEADGAARRLAKLPADHEPAWPPGPLAAAVVVVGMGALGRPAAEVLHRPPAFHRAGRREARVGLAHLQLMVRRYVAAAPPRAPLVLLLTGAVPSPAVARLVHDFTAAVRRRNPRLQDPNVRLRAVATPDLETGPFWIWDLGPGTRSPAPALPGVCGVLLAAGSGTRFGAAGGGSKLLARWRGRPLLEACLRAWMAAGFAELVVVTGHDADRLEPLVRRIAARRGHGPLRLVHNRRHAAGLGTSVRAAVRAADPRLGLLFGHADMPALRPATLRRLANLGSTLRDAIVVPTRRGAPANPVYFPPALRPALQRVPDTDGGRAVYRAHAERVLACELPDPGQLQDVDRRGDLRRLPRLRRRAPRP